MTFQSIIRVILNPTKEFDICMKYMDDPKWTLVNKGDTFRWIFENRTPIVETKATYFDETKGEN